jgi:hypothetical protein
MNWQLNTSETNGKVSELIFEILCHQLGLEAAKNLNDIAPYDYLLLIDGQWWKIQVKTVYETKEYKYPNRIEKSCKLVRLFRSTTKLKSNAKERRYKEGDFDYVFATTGEEHWLIPFNVLKKWCIHVNSNKYDCFRFPKG